MMSWADSSEREEVSELSPEIWYIDDRSPSLVEGGGRGRRLSGGFIIKDLILLKTFQHQTHTEYFKEVIEVNW